MDQKYLDFLKFSYTEFKKSIEETKTLEFKNFSDYVRNGRQEKYDYILRQVNGKPMWFVRCWATDGDWLTIADALVAETECDA